jgi:hypothetical protein
MASTASIRRRDGRDDRGVDLLEAAQPTFDLAVSGELVADLDRQLGDLVLDVMKHQRADADEHPTVLQHRLDLGHQRVVDLQRLDRTERWLGQQRPR